MVGVLAASLALFVAWPGTPPGYYFRDTDRAEIEKAHVLVRPATSLGADRRADEASAGGPAVAPHAPPCGSPGPFPTLLPRDEVAASAADRRALRHASPRAPPRPSRSA